MNPALLRRQEPSTKRRARGAHLVHWTPAFAGEQIDAAERTDAREQEDAATPTNAGEQNEFSHPGGPSVIATPGEHQSASFQASTSHGHSRRTPAVVIPGERSETRNLIN